MTVDPSHDPSRRSWVESANLRDADFPLQNLPLGGRSSGMELKARGSAWPLVTRFSILRPVAQRGMLEGSEAFLTACSAASLNPLMALPAAHRGALRRQVSRILGTGGDTGAATALVPPRPQSPMRLPATIGDYTDFYASIHHATNVGTHVPARQSAAAELQVGADRLSRPRVVDRRQRHAESGGRTARRAGGRRPRRRSARRARWTTSWRSASSIGAGNALGEPVADRRGRRAHLRRLPAQRLVGARHPGVGVSAARAVPREELRHDASRRGWSRCEALAPFPGTRAPRAARAIRRRSHTWTMPHDQARGGFDITLEVHAAARRRCDRRDGAACGSAGAASDRCTGRSPSWSPTTPATAATCVRATCSPAARGLSVPLHAGRRGSRNSHAKREFL